MSDKDVCPCKNDTPGCGYGYTCQLCQIQALESRNARLTEALERSVVALDDWTNTYANTFCDEMRAKEAEERLSEKGTLWYIAQVQKQNRKALEVKI